jgi:hypothetical protein
MKGCHFRVKWFNANMCFNIHPFNYPRQLAYACTPASTDGTPRENEDANLALQI